MIRRIAAAAAVVVCAVAAAAPASAQPSTMPPEPTTPARVQLGPLGIRPALILREVGYDSNVLNGQGSDEGDFTATFGAKVDLGFRVPRLVTNYSSFYEYLYFADFENERGSNRGMEGRMDFLLGRVRPHFTAGIRTSHDRASAEIDARALRQQTSVGVGATAAAFSRTAVNLSYRRSGVDYADDEVFRGVQLATELNAHSDSIVYGMDFEFSPLTTFSVHGEQLFERFELSPDRDADSHRYGVTATLHPLALISGRATLGVRAFRPLSGVVPDFTGITAAIAIGYSFRDESNLALTIDRDVRHSFTEATPYYVSTGARATFTQRLVRNLDGQLVAGFERLAYEARLDVPFAVDERDRVRTLGGGIGVRLSDDARVSVNFDHTARSSPVALREYSRGRMFATVNYGF